MSQSEAMDLLDETGMLRALNIPSEHAGETMKANRRQQFCMLIAVSDVSGLVLSPVICDRHHAYMYIYIYI